MFFKIGVFKNFRKFHKKTPVLESLFNKAAGLKACNFIKKRRQQSFLLVKCEIFKSTFFLKNTSVDCFCHYETPVQDRLYKKVTHHHIILQRLDIRYRDLTDNFEENR